MNYNVIGSSSKGNSIIVEDILMLDCGVSYSKLKPYLKKIKLIFESHVHMDHLNPITIKKILYEYPTIKYLTGSKQVINKLNELKTPINNIIYLNPNKWYDLGALKVKLETLEHDVENYGLHFDIKDKKGVYLVDSCSVENIVAKNYELYLVENNYQEEILEEHIKNCEDENKLYYLNRVKTTHLSKSKCDDFLIKNMGKDSIFNYIHKSSFNNTENGEILT